MYLVLSSYLIHQVSMNFLVASQDKASLFSAVVLIFLLSCTGTVAYEKLQTLLTNKTLVNDIKKLSSDAQTSSLEGFHATLNHWHPKMICFSWLGTFCR